MTVDARAQVAVVVVTYRSSQPLERCLRSLGRAGASVVIVADNGPDDGTEDLVREEFPWVRYVRFADNPGYGEAANRVLRARTEPYALVLNADTAVHPGALDAIASHLGHHRHVGLVGPRLVSLDGSLQPSCYPEPSPWQLFLEESGLGRLRGRLPILRRRHLRTWAHDEVRSVPWVLGAALALRLDAFREVGGFDADYFLYYEEVDLAHRLRGAGWNVEFLPTATITHEGGVSTDQARSAAVVSLFESAARFYRKHGDRADQLALRLAVVLVMSARTLRDRGAEAATWRTIRRAAVRGWPAVAASPTTEQRRRADWRFLLPDRPSPARHVLLLGGHERVVDLGLDATPTVVHRRVAEIDEVDLLVVLHDATDDLGPALALVASGGSAYIEVDRRRAGRRSMTPARVRRALTAAGLTPGGTWWILPNAAAGRRFVPVDQAGPLRWYLRQIVVDGALARRGLVRLADRLGPSARPLLSSFAMTGTRGPDGRPGLLADPRVTTVVGPDASDVVLLTSGHDPGSRAVLLPFDADGTRPLAALKVSPSRDLDGHTEREQQTLAQLRESLGPDLARSIPEPFGAFIHHGYLVGAESAMTGSPVAATSGAGASQSRRLEDLDRVTAWLVDVHRRTTVERARWSGELWERYLQTPLDIYRGAFGTGPAEDALFAAAERWSSRVAGAELPIVRQHFDLGPWNIVRDGDRIGVFDWERGDDRGSGLGPPLCDLLYFTRYWLHTCDGVNTLDGELQGFALDAPSSPYRAGAATAVAGYLAALDIDRRFEPLLHLRTWVEQAAHTALRQAHLGLAAAPAPRPVAYVRALAARQGGLFSGAGVETYR